MRNELNSLAVFDQRSRDLRKRTQEKRKDYRAVNKNQVGGAQISGKAQEIPVGETSNAQRSPRSKNQQMLKSLRNALEDSIPHPSPGGDLRKQQQRTPLGQFDGNLRRTGGSSKRNQGQTPLGRRMIHS